MRKIIAFLLVLLCTQAEAQLINIEKKRVMNKDGLTGHVGFSGRWTENVKTIWALENFISLQYKKNAHLFMVFNDIDFIRVNDEDLTNQGFQHFRYNYTFRDSSAYTWETFVQHQNNAIKQLEIRIISGGGMRFRLVHNEKFYMYFAPLLMYEHEEFADEARSVYDFFKLDAYLVLNINLTDALKFNTITYYQPAFSDFSKYRVAHTSSLQIPLVKNLSFLVSYDLTYDSYPAPGIPNRFSNLKNTIKYIF